ncbi:hypothetical protein SLS58_008008 [Diplodia intermedia]|uniref:Small secreted protein n=1 Tax=Diplodia intermedia TaxID=856260 RepID=A0ABR3TIQ6_9PEZI
MHATGLVTALLTLGVALAAPLSEPAGSNNTNALFRRDNTCLAQDGAAKLWKITLDDDAAHNKNDVTGWSCERDATTGTATYRFATPAGCMLWDMTQALKKCSGGQTIDCSNGYFDGL